MKVKLKFVEFVTFKQNSSLFIRITTIYNTDQYFSQLEYANCKMTAVTAQIKQNLKNVLICERTFAIISVACI